LEKSLNPCAAQGLHRIRQYGLFANGKNRAVNIARPRQLLAVPQSTAQLNIDPAAESDQLRALPNPCPCCGGRMIIIETFARNRGFGAAASAA
jgi:hypothetical protein